MLPLNIEDIDLDQVNRAVASKAAERTDDVRNGLVNDTIKAPPISDSFTIKIEQLDGQMSEKDVEVLERSNIAQPVGVSRMLGASRLC